tara:strand:+ start:137 stop:394 length:258 start_codon:yes stop_codon:yes gene_type:complete
MSTSAFISKVRKNKKQVIKTLGFFILLRSLHGASILFLAYLLGWEIQQLREFEIFGVRIYVLILFVVVLFVVRRFYKIYKWSTSE